MIWKLLLVWGSILAISAEDPCSPWGVRFFFGDHYMTGEGYQYILSFNTNVSCEGFYLRIDNLRFNFTQKEVSYSEESYSKPYQTQIYTAEISGLILSEVRSLTF